MELDINRPASDHSSSFQDYQYLNIDLCLELIFPYLSWIDLVNVADSCKQMKYAAEIEFFRKYKNCESYCGILPCTGSHYFSIRNEITIYDPKICLKILRNFGHLVFKLELSVGLGIKMHLERYVDEFCANHITHLKLTNYYSTAFDISENFRNSFPNVEYFYLNGRIRVGQIGFHQFFPKMQTLSIQGFKNFDHCWLASHFPNLENLFLHNERDLYSTEFQVDIILDAIKLNPQLRDIRLGESISSKPIILQTISEMCKSIEKLCVWIDELNHDYDLIHFNSLKTLEVNLQLWSYLSLRAFHFDALESLYIKSPIRYNLDVECIERHPSITKLYFDYYFKGELYYDDITAEAFAFVKEIEVFWTISTEDAISFLDNLRSLEKLTIRFYLTSSERHSAFNEFKRLVHHRKNILLEIEQLDELGESSIQKAICRKKL